MKRHQTNHWPFFILSLILFHGVWYLASFLLAKPILPSPVIVYQQLPRLFEKQIVAHILASFRRLFIGLFLSLALGGALGIVMGKNKTVNRLLDPLVYLSYPVPKLALLPILMLLFGLGERSKILLIVLIIFPQVVLSVRDAVMAIPKNYYDVYQGIQANTWQTFRDITFPAVTYSLLSTSRISLGTGISVLFFAENYGTDRGMGYFIMDAWMRMDYPSMYAGIVVLSVLGMVLFKIIDYLMQQVHYE